MTETIFAQASGQGRAGVAVIRVSGPQAFPALACLAGAVPPPRTAHLRRLRDARGDPFDNALVIAFPGPKSFTGEDVAELYLHGSPAVCRSVLAALGALPGLRAAEPGEFTRRALMNGRLDLAQVEGLGDLIAAETAAQQRQALRLMEGALSRLSAGWRKELIRALALVEASIDFADDDLPEDLLAAVAPLLAPVKAEIDRQVRGSHMAERLREGFEVALVGAPNVGKSTLLNALAGREAALTSHVAGTTRDVIEVRMDLDGLAVTLLDMAGLRAAAGHVEALGVARARDRAAAADLRVFLLDTPDDGRTLGVERRAGDLGVLAKADVRPSAPGLAVSGLTGQGVEALLAAIAVELRDRAAGAGTVTRERQREAILRACDALDAAERHLAGTAQPELAAAELRAALRALDFLVGAVDVEAVLDVVFQSFCIGK